MTRLRWEQFAQKGKAPEGPKVQELGIKVGRAFQHEHFEYRVCQPYGELREFQKKAILPSITVDWGLRTCVESHISTACTAMRSMMLLE